MTGVGDLGQAILASVPAEIKAQVEPFLPGIVDAIYQAFSIAVASTFAVGIVAAAVAAGLSCCSRRHRRPPRSRLRIPGPALPAPIRPGPDTVT